MPIFILVFDQIEDEPKQQVDLSDTVIFQHSRQIAESHTFVTFVFVGTKVLINLFEVVL